MVATMTSTAPAELRARLAEALAEVAPLVPVVARAAAVVRDAIDVVVAAFPTDIEFDEGHERFMRECGAYALADVLDELSNLIGPS